MERKMAPDEVLKNYSRVRNSGRVSTAFLELLAGELNGLEKEYPDLKVRPSKENGEVYVSSHDKGATGYSLCSGNQVLVYMPLNPQNGDDRIRILVDDSFLVERCDDVLKKNGNLSIKVGLYCLQEAPILN